MKSFFKDKRNLKILKQSGIWAGLLFALYLFQRYVLHEMLFIWMFENEEIYLSMILIGFASLCGKMEAFLYHYKALANEKISKGTLEDMNLHPLFTFLRLMVFIPMAIIGGFGLSLAIWAMFPFWHDGSYYKQRNKLKSGVYLEGWWAQSTTSTAVLTKIFTPIARTVIAILAGTFIAVHIYM